MRGTGRFGSDYQDRLEAAKKRQAHQARLRSIEAAKQKREQAFSSSSKEEIKNTSFSRTAGIPTIASGRGPELVGEFLKDAGTAFATGMQNLGYAGLKKAGMPAHTRGNLGYEDFRRAGAELFTLGGRLAPVKDFMGNTKRETTNATWDDYVGDFLDSYGWFTGGKEAEIPAKLIYESAKPWVKPISKPMVKWAKEGHAGILDALDSRGFGGMLPAVGGTIKTETNVPSGFRLGGIAAARSGLVAHQMNMASADSSWGSARAAREKPVASAEWESGFKELDLNIDAKSGEMSLETYKTAKAHFGDAFPDAEIVGEYAYLPQGAKMTAAAKKLLKELPHNLINPVSAEQINRTGKQGLKRVQEQYARDAHAEEIVASYGLSRPQPSIPSVTNETIDRMKGVFEADYGPAYRYDPVTGVERITNNEHVFSVSPEALRHNFEIRQLEKQMRQAKINPAQRKIMMQELLGRQAEELAFTLDPNQSMLLLSAPTNQGIVGSLSPIAKTEAILRHDPGGIFGTTVPRRSGEERNWFPGTPTKTVEEYHNIVARAENAAPGLVSDTANAFRQAYAETVKPLRNSYTKAKDPKVKKELEKKIKAAEELLYKEYYG